MTITEFIASLSLFEGLPQDQIDDLTTIVADQSFNRHEIIFSEGEDATGFYVVVSGRVKIFKLSIEGREQILHLFGPGEPFGEVAVFTGKPFPANAESMDKSRILFFPRESFVDLIKTNPSIALSMLAILSMRLRRFTFLIDDLSLKEVPGRLAAYLLYLSKEERGAEDLILDITKGQLASLLGTIPETLSRILNRMNKQGLIETAAKHIKIKDRQGLEDLVETGGRF
jgi:CRP/FNR family transcriptional regulator